MKRFILKIERHIIALLPTATRLMIRRDERRLVHGKAWGKVLEIGARGLALKSFVRFDDYKILDIENKPGIDYVQDIHDTSLKPASFDTIFAFEVLEHLYHPHLAVNNMHKLLKPGGILIGSTRFIYPYHGLPHDYFRFSEFGLRHLFKDFKTVTIYPQGSWLITLWEILTNNIFLWPLKIFNPLLILFQNKETIFPLGFTIVAKK